MSSVNNDRPASQTNSAPHPSAGQTAAPSDEGAKTAAQAAARRRHFKDQREKHKPASASSATASAPGSAGLKSPGAKAGVDTAPKFANAKAPAEDKPTGPTDTSDAGAEAKTSGASSTQAPPKSGESNPSGKPGASHKKSTASVEDVVEEAIAGSNYKLLKQADGKLTLTHKDNAVDRAYTITIHPSANLSGSDLAEVGDIVAKLLDVVDEHDKNHGGIKSVTFSGYGGSLKYHNDPELNRTVSFGGPSDQATGTKVHEQLKRLEDLLGRLGKGTAVTFASAPSVTEAEAAKKAAAQAAEAEAKGKAQHAKTDEEPAAPTEGASAAPVPPKAQTQPSAAAPAAPGAAEPTAPGAAAAPSSEHGAAAPNAAPGAEVPNSEPETKPVG